MVKLHGWTGKIAHINLSNRKIATLPTDDYFEKFIGGRGIAVRLYYDFVSPSAQALSPENSIIFMTGPLTGTAAIACSRLSAMFKSPLLYPEQCGLASLGGRLPGKLKAAGYDGLVITGVSDAPCCISVCEGRVTIQPAGRLWGQDIVITQSSLIDEYGQTSESLCIGPAGEKLIRYSIAVSSLGSAAGHGLGAVMGSKQLKAIVVQGNHSVPVAYPEQLKTMNRSIRSMVKGRVLMDPMIGGIELVKRTPCQGCPAGCPRGIYQHVSGKKEFRKNCASAYFYFDRERDHHDGVSGDQSFLATSLCDRQGLDTQELTKLFAWMDSCFDHGILTEDSTGVSWAQVGTAEFFDSFVHDLLERKGRTDILGEGVVRAAHAIGRSAKELLDGIVEGSGFSADLYNGRYFLTNAVFHATDRTNPMAQLHEVVYPLFKWVLWYATDGSMSSVSTDTFLKIAQRFWINEQAVDFSTYEGKGAVAALIQNREYAKETLVACDFFYPLITPEGTDDHVGDPTIESRLLSAVTGKDYSENDYYLIGERIFNLQRMIALREGHRGRKDDVLPDFNFTEPLEIDKIYFGMFNPDFMLPGPGGKLITRKGATLDREQFKMMMNEYYRIRGWDLKTGIPGKDTLKRLAIDDLDDK